MYDSDDVPLSRSYFRRYASQFSALPIKGGNNAWTHRKSVLKDEKLGRPNLDYFRQLAEQFRKEYRQSKLIY